MYIFIYLFFIGDFGIGCVFVHRLRQGTWEKLSRFIDQNIYFWEAPDIIKSYKGEEYVNQTVTFCCLILCIKILVNRRKKLGHARYRSNTKNLVIFLSSSLITFLRLLNYVMLYFPPPADSYWMCHPNVDSIFSVILLLQEIKEGLSMPLEIRNRLVELNFFVLIILQIFLSFTEKKFNLFLAEVANTSMKSNLLIENYQWNIT